MRIFVGSPKFAGIRAGASFDLSALWRRLQPTATGNAAGSFVYVIKDENGVCKVGVSTDPQTRIADLQTGSPQWLNFEYIAMTDSDGFDVESEAHAILDKYRRAGEWFAVSPDMAVAALNAAAHRLGRTLTQVPEARLAAAVRHLRKQIFRNMLSPTGKLVGYLYITAFLILWATVTSYTRDSHIIFTALIGVLLTRFAVLPLLVRFFPRTYCTLIRCDAAQPSRIFTV